MFLQVAPRVGAWIEINALHCQLQLHIVAPRVGAWIEINMLRYILQLVIVAPRVGAWIEINPYIHLLIYRMSLPVWGRGLKSYFFLMDFSTCRRSPCGGVD